MISGLRQTLAAAVQRSSTSANPAAIGSDPNVGNVYMNHQHPGPMQPGGHGPHMGGMPPQGVPTPYGLFGGPPGAPYHGATPGAGASPQGHAPGPQAQHPQGGGCPPPAAPGAPGSGGDALHGQQERDREIDRLRRELRKADEKSNFFRNQVITLQQQVSSMAAPVMGASAAAAMPEEIAKLRKELAEERTERQALQAAAAQFENGLDTAGASALQATLQERERELGAGRARLGELERELAAVRAELVAAHGERDQHAAAAAAANQRAAAAQQAAATAQSQQQAPMTPSRSLSGALGPSQSTAETANSYGSPAPHPPPRMSSATAPAHLVSPQAPPTLHFRGDPLDPNENPGGPRRALVVGCDYPGKIGTLRAGVADAQQWARFFVKRCGLSEQDVRLLSDDPGQYQQKSWAVSTQQNILRALQWLVARSAPGDQLFFVFCGHGAQVVTEEFAGQKMCENACVPTDACEGGEQPRVVSDTDVHKALLLVPSGVQVTLVYDSCHAGRPLDRSGLDFLTEYVSRGRVDYEKLRGHPVLPRFLELQQWKVRATPVEAVRESKLHCQAVQWASCANPQFCVELPIDERPRGVFTYIFISALLKVGVRAQSGPILQEARELTSQLKGRWRLQQDVQFAHSQSSSEAQPFLRAS